MKYWLLSVICAALTFTVLAEDQNKHVVSNCSLVAFMEPMKPSADAVCRAASQLLTWSYAPYEKVQADGKKYLYYLQKPDKRVFIVADHGQVSFPLEAGKYRYFETFVLDEAGKSPRLVQREIDFDRWSKLRECNCNLNCPCWQGLDCTCGSCKAHDSPKEASK